MPFLKVLAPVLLITYGNISRSSAVCTSDSHINKLQFSLVRNCQRSAMPAIAYKNTLTLKDCMHEAKLARGLALNFGAYTRHMQMKKDIVETNTKLEQITRPNTNNSNENRQSVWHKPQLHFNCHILACPENITMRSVVNDSRYDYYSLYGEPIGAKFLKFHFITFYGTIFLYITATENYACIPQVGLFQFQATKTNFLNATQLCNNATASGGVAVLAHVASAQRTDAFAELLRETNEQARQMYGQQHSLAYVGLQFNRSYSSQTIEYLNMEKEPLHCFQFVAWAPGHPRTSANFANISCIAITIERTWLTVDCERELPSICEIYTSRSILNETSITAGTCSPGSYS
ncbi:unnamed protein product [Ceratitis capitata]|uniref:(Mediterranean fruit fly) hypothetical protein n=1 Tax=Ceratitis capitata TaxID=7213 RepID=A0A811VHD3_CERCA|nr:unnamed protein product [Ceratitis capitata]